MADKETGKKSGKGDKSKDDKPAKGDKSKGDKAEGEGYQFKVPRFDEDAFIHKELTGFRTTTILFVWGILAALLTWFMFRAMGLGTAQWYLGALIAAAFGIALKWLFPTFKADISHYKRKEWFGTGFLFFFTWLAFVILLINPPFADFAPPALEVHANPPLQQVGHPVVLDLFLSDNAGVTDFDFEVRQGNNTIADAAALEQIAHDHYRYIASGLGGGIYHYTLTARDSAGHEANVTGRFDVRSRAINIELPPGNGLDQRSDILLVTFSTPSGNPFDPEEDLRTVYLQMVDDAERRVHLEHDSALGGWKATANFAGWQEGNNTFTVVAEMPNTFHGQTRIDGGRLLLTGPFSLDVTASIGDYQPKVPAPNLDAPSREVPGFEAVAVLAALGAVAVVARRRRS